MGRRRMIEPWKNPRSKVWWFRRRVPAKYRKLGLPAEIKFSLETKDWDNADDLCQDFNLTLERQWKANLANLEKPSDEVSHLQIAALAGEFYRDTVAANRENPGAAEAWEKKLRAIEEVKHRRFLPPDAWLPVVYGGEARAFLERKGVKLGGKKFDSFLDSFLTAKREAAEELVRNANNDYSKNDKVTERYPMYEPSKPARMFDALWGEFTVARKLSASTLRKWEPYFAKLRKRVGTDDMSRVTEEHLLDWRDALLASEISPVTVRDGYIAAARAFFRWAKKQKKLPTNPAAEVFVEADKHETDMRGFTHEEAAKILAAALAPMNEAMTEENAAARKWVPWLRAYTGARVNEMTQLRACDVLDVDGIPSVRITPEAGRVKRDKKRTVPLHPHLIDMGFLEYSPLIRRQEAPIPRFCDRRVPENLFSAYFTEPYGAPNIEWSARPGVARQSCARPPSTATSLAVMKLLEADASEGESDRKPTAADEPVRHEQRLSE